MQSLLLPPELDRRAVALNFDLISPCGWEKLFERERKNGLFELRVPGPDYVLNVHYDTRMLIEWLIRNHRYTLAQVRDLFHEAPPVRPAVKQHLLVG